MMIYAGHRLSCDLLQMLSFFFGIIMTPFDQKKDSILRDILAHDEANPDASPKGTIDSLCIPLIKAINKHPDLVTTSTCLGRVSVFLEGVKTKSQIGAKGNDGKWLFVTHHPEELHNWHKSIDFVYQDPMLDNLHGNTRYILFKFEPVILHVKCRDFASACLLYSTAMACGFRESGIGSNNIVGIRISIKLDIPIGCLDDTSNKLVAFVSESYLQLITRLSMDRFDENFKKMAALQRAIESMGPVKPHQPQESKEERRLRKMNEGLERRDAVRAEKEKLRKEKEQQKAVQES